MFHDLFYLLFPFGSGCAVVASQFDEEVLSRKERFEFHLNLDVLGLGILIQFLEVVVLDELSRALVVAEEVMNGLLQFGFDL